MRVKMTLKPNAYFKNVQEITIKFLLKKKIKALILDVDNTLIDYNKNLSDSVLKWAYELQGQGIKMYILSNTNKKEKVENVAQKLNIEYELFAKKPAKKGFLKAQKKLNFNPENIGVVGDQIFTDIIGGNRCKMFTILVDPVDKKDFWYTAWKRPLENLIKKKLKKRGIIMYVNDIYIIWYILIAILGVFAGEFTNWMIKRFSQEKKIFSKDIFKEYKREFKPNYILIIITICLFIGILYKFGIKSTLAENLDLIKFLILTPMLETVVVIDYKLQIIPNRLNLTMFEIGLIFAFLLGISNSAISINLFLGSLVGGGIFLAITLLGGLIYGKEAMGLGDVKLMGALGLYFGLTNIIIVSLVSFLTGAILSILLLITKIKKTDEYIPFGPFIVIGAFISIFMPYESIINILMTIFTLGLFKK